MAKTPLERRLPAPQPSSVVRLAQTAFPSRGRPRHDSRPVAFVLGFAIVARSSGDPDALLYARDSRHSTENEAMSMYVGEALVGEGNEIAHIDLLIGSKDGPVGTAFANALATQ